MDDDAIKVLVTRLARVRPGGGTVIERAAIMAEGTGSQAILAWIAEHGGEPEATVQSSAPSGLHGRRNEPSAASRTPSRFVLPAGALD
jgi:hypothetical protein